MRPKTPRVYADTSVFGGAFDEEFSVPSRQFFESVRQGSFHLVVSDVVRRELGPAPEEVVGLWRDVLPVTEVVRVTPEAVALQQAYLDAGVVSPGSAEDALHVALATAHMCTMIVSWNFRHIVHFEKIDRYNAVNTLEGFGHIAIYSPPEVVEYEEQDKDV